MPNPSPTKRPSIESLGVKKWLERRGLSYAEIKTLIGDDPDNRRVSMYKLADVIGTKSKGTAYRLLAQYKKEMAQ